MPVILRRREWVADDWHHLGASPAAPGDTDSVIVPLATFRADCARWQNRHGRLGVRVGPADAVEELAPALTRIALVAIEFPGPADGRGFTQARLLRERCQFSGELRAVGAGVKQDLLFLMARCGFDSFELAAGESPESALRALDRYSVAYQPGAAVESIRMQRFFARVPAAADSRQSAL